MPARGSSGGSSSLPTIVPQRVNNFISVDKYYRSANLLIRQANEYRARHNELQLYTMLMRLASLIVETIPDHKDFSKSSPEYRSLRQALLQKYMQELEDLKLHLRLKIGADSSIWLRQPSSHTPDTVQISTSNLPELDWDRLATASSASAPQGRPSTFAAASASVLPTASFDLLTGTSSTAFPVSQGQPSSSGATELPTFRYDLKSTSQAARDRHALLPKAPAVVSKRPSGGLESSLYPQFTDSPFAPIDYSRGGHSQPQPLDQQLAGMDVAARNGVQSLMDAMPAPRPSPLLDAQELEVQSLMAPSGPPEPGATCCEVPDPPPPPPPEEQPGGVSKLRELREVHISVALMEEFLAYAKANTRKGVESCGILAGVLDKRGLFSITTLIVPKQEGTSDTVQALAEEEIFDVQDKRGLYPMGWIHTHPTQTCFLSSIDVHTQCGYQTMLEEAIAIVMAPSDRSKRCGIFRLSTPGGLKLVQKCQSRGFHAHPPTETGQPVYELCGHVYLNERLKHDVVDLR